MQSVPVRKVLSWLHNQVRYRSLRACLQRGRGGGLVRLGSAYGGWWVPQTSLVPGAVAYCAGAGEDISFDLALHRAGLKVTTFDPTPRAISFVREHGPDSDRFHFEPIGWWSSQTVARFYAPRNPEHVSHSVVNLAGTSEFFEAPVMPVAELMAQLGDGHVDIIKMDIEGAEYEVIDSLLRHGPLPDTLCVEFDQPEPLRRTVGAVRALHRAGYSLRKVDQWNYTFIRTDVED